MAQAVEISINYADVCLSPRTEVQEEEPEAEVDYEDESAAAKAVDKGYQRL